MTWQTIDTAPKDGTRVILFRSGWEEDTAIGYFAKIWDEWITVCGAASFFGATHWMPLPESPKPLQWNNLDGLSGGCTHEWGNISLHTLDYE